MIIQPIYPQDSARTDGSTPYDTIWATSQVPAQEAVGLERTMLAEDKLYVVLAVVLIIWFGIVFFIWRTDRSLHALERTADESIPEKTT